MSKQDTEKNNLTPIKRPLKFSLVLIHKHLLAGGTLDVGQNSEVVPHTSKACQNLENEKDIILRILCTLFISDFV